MRDLRRWRALPPMLTVLLAAASGLSSHAGHAGEVSRASQVSPAAHPGTSGRSSKHGPGSQRQTEAQLAAVRSEIARVRAKVDHDHVETDKLTRSLRDAELAVASARDGLDRVHRERSDRVSQRTQLAAQRREHETRLAAERAALAGELRAAYVIGREEPLKLLLNQRDPARAGRIFVYYDYFARSRADGLARIAADLHSIGELDQQLALEEQHLGELEDTQRTQVAELESARSARAQALTTLQAESHNREQTLVRLQREQSGLEELLRELRRALERFPIDSHDAFARLRGDLAWPVGGRIVASFGQPRAGALKWDGMLIETQRGAPVRAVYHGRVIFADWLPGLGLLLIVDHGDGYLSLYGHNERLYKSVGEPVTAGDAIAAAGDSGGSSRPELYFEIRKAGHPVDPRPWFKLAAPAAP
ncbi:MAG TPA: peptidoglycan DD-metalloendopeptidase family protein [Steroidobacteraceae bacterium]|nr:peptidoglycan DD-metalloendopeptidase family protein [Steroidobacteraceae bacterium]